MFKKYYIYDIGPLLERFNKNYKKIKEKIIEFSKKGSFPTFPDKKEYIEFLKGNVTIRIVEIIDKPPYMQLLITLISTDKKSLEELVKEISKIAPGTKIEKEILRREYNPETRETRFL